MDLIYSTRSAFAAKKMDGTVVTWGDPAYGSDSSSVAEHFVTQKSDGDALAAKKTVAGASLSGPGGDSAPTDKQEAIPSAGRNKSFSGETWLFFAAVAAFCPVLCFSFRWFRNAVRYYRRGGVRDLTLELMSTSAE